MIVRQTDTKAIPSLLLGLLALLPLLLGCRATIQEYPIPPSRDGRAYSLSADTVHLDTLPSMLLSSTYSLRLFNPGTNPLELSSIRLKGGDSRGFRLNVDGRAGGAEGLSIEGRDSIFIFVRAYLPEGLSDSPTSVMDSIVVTEAGGRVSYIPIVAVRQNVQHLSALIVRSHETLSSTRPILIKDSIYIAPGASLTLTPGTRLLMASSAHIRVEGELLAEGMPQERISLGSIRRDQFLPRVPYSRVPGQWGGIVVGKAGSIKARHMELTNAKWGIYFVEESEAAPKERLELRYCRLHNISGIGISASRGLYVIEDCELSNTLATTLSLWGGDYTIRRSSIINHYPWPGIRSSAALSFSNAPRGSTIGERGGRLLVERSVVDGSLGVSASRASGGEVNITIFGPQEGSPTVRLVDSYLRMHHYDSPHIEASGIVYAESQREANPTYTRLGLDSLGRKDYRFDFRPTPKAPFVGLIRTGEPDLPPDLSGKARLVPASYGAYEPAD